VTDFDANKSPKCIGQSIVRAVIRPDRKQIATNARPLVESEFTHKVTAETYKNMLDSLKQKI
jgi:hypothetical protein